MMAKPTPADVMRARLEMDGVPWMNRKTTHRHIESYIDPSAIVGERTLAWHYSRILAKVRIGEDCSIGGGTEIGMGSHIGNRSRIGANVFLPPRSIIGEDVFVGPGVVCTDDKHPVCGNSGYIAQPPTIRDGASIGAGAILLPGVTIGTHARVAAGAIVTKDVPDYGCVVGTPAREYAVPESWKTNPSPLAEDALNGPLGHLAVD
jgi:UDP-2-acetamido-3-amino-2,3-dideoxy-glucuronate N-acetyltransferase